VVAQQEMAEGDGLRLLGVVCVPGEYRVGVLSRALEQDVLKCQDLLDGAVDRIAGRHPVDRHEEVVAGAPGMEPAPDRVT
jgi:hypothetical protein